MTCNNIDKLPPPLLRPGRIDVKVLIDYAGRQQIEEMFFKFFGYDPETLEVIVDGYGKERIDNLKRQFASRIPEGKVTTAELESYFISLWMECAPENPAEGIFDRVFDGIPEFLKKVEFDRKQAMRHYGADKKKDEDTTAAKKQEKTAETVDSGTESVDTWPLDEKEL